MPNDIINRLALTSHEQAKQAAQRGKQAGRVSDISAALIDATVRRATQAASAIVQPASDAGARAVWSDVLDVLADAGLTPALHCSRSGRALGVVSPDAWQDYLSAIARLGETREADNALERLTAAIIAQKAHTIGPAVLVTSGASLAMIRETCPADFLAIALGRIWPIPDRATTTEKAQRAEKLGAARAAIASLPRPAQEYACEVVTLYLSHVLPARIPTDVDALAFYGAGAAADLVAPVRDVAALGHFCGRIVQTLVALLSRHRLRPLDKITPADLASLRVHWHHDAAFSAVKAARHEWRHAERLASDRARDDRGQLLYTKTQEKALAGVGGSLLASTMAALENALDLSALLTASGRPTVVQTQSDAQAEAALSRRADLVELREKAQAARDSEAEALDLFDLSSLLVAGDLPAELVPVVETETDLLDMGLIELDDLDGWASDDDDDPLDDPDAMPAELIDHAMQQATPTARKPAKPKPPRGGRHADAIAQGLAAFEGSAAPTRRTIGTPKPAPSATTTPKRRTIS